MIAAIFFYLAWLFGVFTCSLLLTALFRIWWSLHALSQLDEHGYTVITCTPFEQLHTIRPICDQHNISYQLIYFGRLCGRGLDWLKSRSVDV